MNFTNEQLTKAKQAKTAEELLEMAKASGIEMTADEAAKYFAELNKQGELTENELAAVAGGDKGDPEPVEYNYESFVGYGVSFNTIPPCPNGLGLTCCDECEGFVYNSYNSYYCCNGHHKRKEN